MSFTKKIIQRVDRGECIYRSMYVATHIYQDKPTYYYYHLIEYNSE